MTRQGLRTAHASHETSPAGARLMSRLVKCLNDDDPAEVSIAWATSAGPTRVRLCGHCAAAWWSRWGSTPTGETAVISDDPGLPMLMQGVEVEEAA